MTVCVVVALEAQVGGAGLHGGKPALQVGPPALQRWYRIQGIRCLGIRVSGMASGPAQVLQEPGHHQVLGYQGIQDG